MYLKDPTKRVQYTFRIKEQLMEDLRAYSEAKDVKIPRLLNDIIEEYLAGMNLSNTWLRDPLNIIITIPKDRKQNDTDNLLFGGIKGGLKYEVKALPVNLDLWDDKHGYISNINGVQHNGVELLAIPGIINDIELEDTDETRQNIGQCLIALYFRKMDNGQVYIGIIDPNNAIERLQFVNPNLAKAYAKYYESFNNIVEDHLANLNSTNQEHVKNQLLEDLEALAEAVNTGNIVPITTTNIVYDKVKIFDVANTGIVATNMPKDILTSNNPYLILEMQNRIDELEKENKAFKEQLGQIDEIMERLDIAKIVKKVSWEDVEKEYNKK